MKKFTLIVILLSLSIGIFAQSTPVSDLRVQDASKTFGINLPVGTKVYDITSKTYWVATTGVAYTESLTSAAGSFKQLNADGASFVTIDQTVKQTIGSATNGLTNLWTDDLTVANIINGSITGNAANVTSVVAVDHGGTGLATLDVDSYMIGAGTANVKFIAKEDVVANIGAAPIASASLFWVDSFDETADILTGSTHTLTKTLKAGCSVLVMLNGSTLVVDKQYSITGQVVTIIIPVSLYDVVTISYGY